MILDYKEIPQANRGSGLQDTFELFARDFFELMGFDIIQHPDRGADGKKDLIIGESRNGVIGQTHFRWLVSCKHYAHSGKSVSDIDEPDIRDRISAHSCDGFIGFYSTIGAVSLTGKLEGNQSNFESEIFDRERIEQKLLRSVDGIDLARRYFPISLEKFIKENPKPANIFSEETKVLCDECGKNLLTGESGNIVFLYRKLPKAGPPPKKLPELHYEISNTKDVYFCCSGLCDVILEKKYKYKGLYCLGWESIDDILIPTFFIKHIIAFINNVFNNQYDKNALEKIKLFYISVFPYITRELTSKEKERISDLMSGGLFYGEIYE